MMRRRPRRALTGRSAAVAVALLADRRWGEPPLDPHPVAAFGTVMERVESALPARRSAGVAYTAAGSVLGALAGFALRGTAPATYVSVAGRALADAAAEVAGPLERGDLDRARHSLRALVGRDTENLDEAGIVRAAVESIAENTSDAVVAPAMWGVLAGAPGTLAYRAVNTMDAMVGHRTPRHERFGWASARLDDIANWVPARLTALLVALARPGAAGPVWRAVRDDAPAHPSPNAGVAEAAFAAALGIRLGGVTTYAGRADDRPVLGTGRDPRIGDITAALRLARDVERRLVCVLFVTAACGLVAPRGRGHARATHRKDTRQEVAPLQQNCNPALLAPSRRRPIPSRTRTSRLRGACRRAVGRARHAAGKDHS